MTDEEIKARLDQDPALAGLIERAFQLGYRAAMAESRLVLGKLSASDQADVFNVQDMLDWLNAKLKEQP